MFHFLKICGISYIIVVFLLKYPSFFFSSFHRTRNRIVERLIKRGPQARPTEGFYGCEKFEKMLWFCDLLILNKDSVFIAVKRDANFYTT